MNLGHRYGLPLLIALIISATAPPSLAQDFRNAEAAVEQGVIYVQQGQLEDAIAAF